MDVAGGDGDIGQVRHPVLVGAMDLEVARDEREDRPVVVAVGGAGEAPSSQRVEFVLAHEPADLLSVDDKAAVAELPEDRLRPARDVRRLPPDRPNGRLLAGYSVKHRRQPGRGSLAGSAGNDVRVGGEALHDEWEPRELAPDGKPRPRVSALSPMIATVDEMESRGYLTMWPRAPLPGISDVIAIAGEEFHDMLLGKKSRAEATSAAQSRAVAALAPAGRRPL